MDGGNKPTDGLTNNNSWRSSWVSMELHKTKQGGALPILFLPAKRKRRREERKKSYTETGIRGRGVKKEKIVCCSFNFKN